MRSPRYTILIASRNTGVVRRLTLTRRRLGAIAAALLVIPGFAGLVTLGMGHSDRTDLEALRLANDSLRLENDSYREATGELATQISTLQSALTELGEKAELDANVRQAMEQLPAVVRSRAMGGSALPGDLARQAAAASAPGSTFGVLRGLVGSIENRLTSMRTKVEEQQALASATPSIFPVIGWLSSSFGSRKDPFTGDLDKHPGIDIAASRGTPVHATADGVVESASYNGNYGNAVLLSHGFGIETRYGHLSGYAVTVGQKVKRNQVIGYVGATGRATSPHLHFEVLLNNNPINPLSLLVGPRR